MKGDFTRGHRPDKKRGEKYRRVLLQEGRLITDSDIAAGADATDALLRDLAADLGCQTGSPNLGYLATSGPLLAVFETLDGVVLPAPGGLFKAYRDYEAKYQERFPSIYIGAQAASGFVKITARRKLSAGTHPKIRFWIKANVNVDVRIEGVSTAQPIPASDATKLQLYDVPVPAGVVDYQQIEIGFSAFGPTNEAWVGFIEAHEPAQATPHFWFTRGRYYLRGLSVESDEDGIYSDATFPSSKGFSSVDVVPAPGGYLVAYLESWERLITRIEDPGILEQALGGVLDTTVRSKALGQVKVALFADGDPLAQAAVVPKAFAVVDAGAGKLQVTTKATTDNLDPCAIPEAGGYTGADNRFYRFEVHTGGALGTADFKWSKNNGSDAFAVANATTAFVTMAPGAEIRDGDLIELVAETDDLGDASAASVSLTTPSFKPSVRRVGWLFYAETTATSGQIKLRDLTTKKVVEPVPADFVDNVHGARLVRVWHGRLVTKPEQVGGPITKFDIGDGIVVELSGSDFRPGDYWQHEARKIKDNDNGPQVNLARGPDGPERLFAPLALFRYDGSGFPLALIRWYDHQYSAICDLNADDIAYDGGKVGTSADTVQEALDELYSRHEGGCCDIPFAPSKTSIDDTDRLQEAIDDVVDGGTICLERGIYRVFGKLDVTDKRVTLAGCPHATIIGKGGQNSVFHLADKAQLTLRDLLVVLHDGPAPVVQISLTDEGEGGPTRVPFLGLLRTALVHTDQEGIAVRVAEPNLPPIDPKDPELPPLDPEFYRGGAIRAEDSILLGTSGIVADHLDAAELSDSLIVFAKFGLIAMWVESIQIFRSNFQGWLTDNFLQSIRDAAEEDLEWAVSTVVEQGADNYPQPDSLALVAGRLYNPNPGTAIQGSSFAAGTAMLVDWAYNLVSRENQYMGSSGPAIRIDSIYNVCFHQDEIHAQYYAEYAAFWAPWQTDGLEIEECSISGALGIVFSAGANGAPLPPGFWYPWVYQVRIQGNEISAYDRGIAFGPSIPEEENSHPPVISLERVEVTSNTIGSYSSYTRVGLVCTMHDPEPWDQGNVRVPRLCIAGNRIDASVGVIALGNDVVVRDNTVHSSHSLTGVNSILGLPLLGAGRIGIYLADGGRTVVSGNVVDLDPREMPEHGKGSVGILLHEMWREGARMNIVVRSNTVRASMPLWIAVGETGAATQDTMIEANRFTGSVCRLDDLQDSTVRGNTFAGGIFMDTGRDNVVSGNRASYFPDWNLTLHITYAQGAWQIENNRALGTLLIQPAIVPYSLNLDNYQAFIDSLLFWQDPQNGGGVGPISAKPVQAWFARYLAAIGVPTIDRELKYAVQVEGNWASGDLVVGYPPTAYTPPLVPPLATYQPALADAESTIQIVGNRADSALVTNTYGKLVVAHNFARFYNVSGWSQVGSITSPNFDAP